MEANFVKYYTELLRFRSERERRSCELSDYRALLRSLQTCQADTARCGQDCPARTILDDRLVADWLAAIDERFVCYWCLVLGDILTQLSFQAAPLHNKNKPGRKVVFVRNSTKNNSSNSTLPKTDKRSVVPGFYRSRN